MMPGPFLGYVLHWFVSAVALMVTAYVVPGFRVKSFGSALVAALVIGIVNLFVFPILAFLTLPINILTLGLFTFVIDGVILKIAAAILKDFDITSWVSAIFGAFILALVGTFLHYVLI